jgi:hypothetical protein
VQIADSLTVAGNLTVNGTLTSLDTTNLDIEDNLFQLNAGLTGSPVNDSGMLINRGDQDNGIFMWDESVDKFTLGLTTADGTATGNITLNSLGTLVANLEGNVTGAVTGTVSSLYNHDTGDLAEGSNLYYTQARFDSAFTAKSTSDLSEGSNLYYTDARFDTRLATKDTDDIAEGLTNLYYTSARFDSAFGGKSTSDLSEGTNLYYTDARVQAVSINNVVEDTTPQLGGNLDLNSSDITGTGDINITGTVTADGLTVDGNATLQGASSPTLRITDSDTPTTAFISSTNSSTRFGSETNTDVFLMSNNTLRVQIDGPTGDISFYEDTGTTAKFFWDASTERLGLGTTSPSSKLHIEGSAPEFRIYSDNTTGGNINFIDQSWQSQIQGSAGSLLFKTGGTAEAMLIDANQNVLVGKTSLYSPDQGIHLDPDGTVYGTRPNQASGVFNRKTSDGNIVIFEKDGSTVGSIGNNGDNLGIESVDVGLLFLSGSSQIIPTGGNFGVSDGTKDLGRTTTRFKDLYLSGAVKVGSYATELLDGGLKFKFNGGAFIDQNTVGQPLSFRVSNASSIDTTTMTLDSSGNVGINTSSPAATLDLGAAEGIKQYIYNGGTVRAGFGVDLSGSSRELSIFHSSSGTDGNISFGKRAESGGAYTEAMRIDGSKRVQINTTTASPVNVGNHYFVVELDSSTAGIAVGADGLVDSRRAMTFYNDNGTVGSITTSGSSTTYNTSSDYRLKENVDYEFNALDRVAQLKPARFNFIADADTTVDGFLAHEVQDIVPEAITGEKDAVREEEYEITPAVLDDDGNVVTEAVMGTREVPEYQGIDQSKLVPLLTKAIQEQQELINNLTARIEQLEN